MRGGCLSVEVLEPRRLMSAVADAGDTLADARNLQSLGTLRPQRVNESLDPAGGDSADYYRFSIASERQLAIKLDRLSDNLDLELLNASGGVVATSKRDGVATEYITKQLRKGDYFVRVVGGDPALGDGSSNYRLNIAGTSADTFFSLAAIAQAATSTPTGDLYLFIKDARGDVGITAYKNWIDINSYGWRVTLPSSIGGAGGADKPTFSEVAITKLSDVASVPLFRILTGHTVQNGVAIVIYDSAKRIERLRITLDGAFVTALSTTQTDGEAGQEDLSVAFSKIQIRYTKVDSNGNAGPVIEAAWDLNTNNS
jgi:type VI protein secretion system component Hcp